MKLIMMSGLPASGKTTKAKELVAQGNWARVNRDLLREMLHFSKWSPKNEEETVSAEKEIVKKLLLKDVNVVIDDVNLNPKNKQLWSNIAKENNASFQHVHIDTPVDECVRRDNEREGSVGKHVIYGFALQYRLLGEGRPSKPFIICDIDGTLADCSNRLHFVKNTENKDWKSFFGSLSEDSPREEIFQMVHDYYKQGYEIILMSGRPDTYRKETEEWIKKYSPEGLVFTTLIMRGSHNRRPDTEVKWELHEKFLSHYPIEAIIDDRPSVIRMWREKGLNVIDVGGGVEF